jgi:hypothetical protein
MRTDLLLWTVGVLLTASTVALSAHHTVAQVFDITKHVTLEGTVTKVEWKDPHVILHLDARGDERRTIQWRLETLNPQGLSRAGLNQDSFKVGDVLTAAVCVAKDGAQLAVTHEITRPGGAASVSVGSC